MRDMVAVHPVIVDQSGPMLDEEHHVHGDARHIQL